MNCGYFDAPSTVLIERYPVDRPTHQLFYASIALNGAVLIHGSSFTVRGFMRHLNRLLFRLWCPSKRSSNIATIFTSLAIDPLVFKRKLQSLLLGSLQFVVSRKLDPKVSKTTNAQKGKAEFFPLHSIRKEQAKQPIKRGNIFSTRSYNLPRWMKIG